MAMSPVATSIDYLKDKTTRNCNVNEILSEENVEGKIIIVTGCNTGIGKHVVIGLAKKGAKIIMACRDLKKAEDAADDIKKIVENAQLDIMKLDLADLSSVRQFAEEFMAKYPHLNVLVNNAGFMDVNPVIKKTKDGFENHMGINHLGPFLLTRLLIDHLKKASPSRIVSVASTNLIMSTLDFEDLMMEKNPKFGDSGKEPYNNSKLANALCVTALGNKLKEQGIGINTYNICPGLVKTDVFRNNDSWFKRTVMNVQLCIVGLKPEEGAESILYCTISSKVANDTSKMYRFCREWGPGTKALHNEALSKKMWDITHELLDIKDSEKF